jgi:hypothetical protein
LALPDDVSLHLKPSGLITMVTRLNVINRLHVHPTSDVRRAGMGPVPVGHGCAHYSSLSPVVLLTHEPNFSYAYYAYFTKGLLLQFVFIHFTYTLLGWHMKRLVMIALMMLLNLAPAAWAANWVPLGVYAFYMPPWSQIKCEVSLDRDSIVKSGDRLGFMLRATDVSSDFYYMTSDCRTRRVVMIKWYDSKKAKWNGMRSNVIDADRDTVWEPILNKVCDSYGR